MQTGRLRRAPAAFSGDDFETARGHGANQNRLQHAMGADRCDQFVHRIIDKLPAGLVRIGCYIGNSQPRYPGCIGIDWGSRFF